MPGIMEALKHGVQRQFVLIKSLLDYNHFTMLSTIFNTTLGHVTCQVLTKAPFHRVIIVNQLCPVTNAHVRI